MNIEGLRYWLHEEKGVTPCILKCTTEYHRILAIVCYLPAPVQFTHTEPLMPEQANAELIDVDDGDERTVIRAGDVERAIWALWPDAVHASVGGDHKVHVFMDGGLEAWQQAYAEALREALS